MRRNLQDIEREQKNLKRKILRAEESGDVKRLLGMRGQLGRIRKDLETMKEDYTPPKPSVRRSYAFETFVESLIYDSNVEAFVFCQFGGPVYFTIPTLETSPFS